MLRFWPEPIGQEKEIRNRARDFVARNLRPFAREDDEKCRFRREAFREAGRQGLLAVVRPKEYGGRGYSHRAYYGGLEELARGSVAFTVTVAVSNLVQGAIADFGSDAQKREYLPRLASGEWIGAFSLSEPGSGSDAASLRCRAEKADGGYRITGTKCWCSSGGYADVYLLMARTSEPKTRGISAFLVPKDTPGFSVGKLEKKMGWNSSSLAELVFEGAFLPESCRLLKEGHGLAVALSQLDSGRIGIAAVGIGLATDAIERVGKYWSDRGGVPEFVRSGLARHYAQLQAVKGLLLVAADLKDTKGSVTTVASQVKLLGSDLAMAVATDAIDWLGMDGSLPEHEVERLFRDAKALQIVEGTNQIQQFVLAREMEEMLQ